MKKFISLMLLFAMASFSWAQDEEEEEEEEDVVEVVKPKAAVKKTPSSPSKLGMQIGFDGSLSNIMLVYDMGTGIKVRGGLDFTQYTEAAGTPTDPAATKTKNIISLSIGGDYELGKTLLPYGVGADLDYNLDSKLITLYPAFYTEAELVKNLSLGLKAGLLYQKPDGGDAVMSLETRGLISFYFM